MGGMGVRARRRCGKSLGGEEPDGLEEGGIGFARFATRRTSDRSISSASSCRLGSLPSPVITAAAACSSKDPRITERAARARPASFEACWMLQFNADATLA